MSEIRYKPCKPYQLNTLGVCLFGRPFFPEQQDVCPREWYTKEFEGKADGWLTDTSFEHLQTQIEDYLRFIFPRLNTAQLTFNWAFLIGAFVFGIVPGCIGLVIIFLNGDKSRLAFKEMCKRAFDLEMEARQRHVPPEGRAVDLISHHLVCTYFQTFQSASWTPTNPISWYEKFKKLQDVPKFCTRHTGLILDEYELLSDHQELVPAATKKAVDMLSRPRPGGSTRYIFLTFLTLTLLVGSVLLSIFFDNDPPEQPEVSLVVGGIVIGLFLMLSSLYLWSWMPVARRIAGLVRPATERWAAGSISDDTIESVTDLGMLSILVTELDKERMYIPSMMYWRHVGPVIDDEPSQTGGASIRSSLSRFSTTHPHQPQSTLNSTSSMQSYAGSHPHSVPGSPGRKAPATAGLGKIREAQAKSQAIQSHAVLVSSQHQYQDSPVQRLTRSGVEQGVSGGALSDVSTGVAFQGSAGEPLEPSEATLGEHPGAAMGASDH